MLIFCGSSAWTTVLSCTVINYYCIVELQTPNGRSMAKQSIEHTELADGLYTGYGRTDTQPARVVSVSAILAWSHLFILRLLSWSLTEPRDFKIRLFVRSLSIQAIRVHCTTRNSVLNQHY
jgi:hypothetical protein